MTETRYIIGIDLGTTNSVLSFLDTSIAEEDQKTELQPIPQLVNPGEIEDQVLLPSSLYIPGELDFPQGSLALPWEEHPQYLIGELARKRGAENPARLVASAKSWLSYSEVNRNSPILPWNSPEEVPKLSPVEVSSRYLSYLRSVWDNNLEKKNSDLKLSEQEIFLTVPASFDEEARELTVSAAQQAGLKHITLLEEPQAAFYAWIDSQGDRWRKEVKRGDLILVCDVGGGTTDFSLISVSEENGELLLERIAVGNHILLGGDNMDLALARMLQQRLEENGTRIDTWQLHSLWHQCRLGKEKLFIDSKASKHPIALLGKGTKLIGGTIKTELTRNDVNQILIDGFFPKVSKDELPARQRRVGFQELGLPYAADPAITKHLASFLSQQNQTGENSAVRRGKSGFACPTHILFNGGVMKAELLQNRLVEVLNDWIIQEEFEPIKILTSANLDHAVSRGAVYYGKTKRGKGIRIRSGSPRTYYIGIESAMPAIPGMTAPLKALCVVPFGMEEGTESTIEGREFGLVVGEPAEFRFLNSTVRKQDKIGSLIETLTDDIQESNPLEVTLKLDGQEDKIIPVRLESRVTEVGTLELWCISRDNQNRWKLECNIREKDEG